jgi:LysM repeat protein
MTKTAQDYPVTTPYGAIIRGKMHRGDDHACPRRTPLVIDGTLVAYTGNTGDVIPKPTPQNPDAGAHVHIQAGSDLGCQQTFEPGRLKFKPGKVVALRHTDPGTAGSWGKFFTLQVGNEYITYAHLDEVLVTIGQQVGGGSQAPRKSNEDLATEVIQGKWGNGEERKRRLTEAGYDYAAVQAIVNARMNSQKSAPQQRTYVVLKNDTLSKIANKYGTNWKTLYELNKSVIGPDPNLIKPGQVLRLP